MHIFTYAYAHTYVYIYICIGVDIWGGLLGPDFVAVNLLCPTPITTFSMPRPKKKSLQKCNPSLDKSSLQRQEVFKRPFKNHVDVCSDF